MDLEHIIKKNDDYHIICATLSFSSNLQSFYIYL